jgi:hypothetical protein
MKEEPFAELLESGQERGAILRGTKSLFREFFLKNWMCKMFGLIISFLKRILLRSRYQQGYPAKLGTGATPAPGICVRFVAGSS